MVQIESHKRFLQTKRAFAGDLDSQLSNDGTTPKEVISVVGHVHIRWISFALRRAAEEHVMAPRYLCVLFRCFRIFCVLHIPGK